MSQYDRKDKYYQRAKQEGYPARSAYKLIELDKKFSILRPGRALVDLGCAPGGWLKVSEEKLKGNGILVGIDLLPLQYEPADWVHFFQGNFEEPANREKIKALIPDGADWILSDMSPNISGIKFKDLAASLEVCELASTFAMDNLKKGGGLIVKIFPGPESAEFKKQIRGAFTKISEVIPDSTRKTSNEVYLVAEKKVQGV